MSRVSFTLLENGRRASLAGAVARFEDLALIHGDDPGEAVLDYALPPAGEAPDLEIRPGRYRIQLILPGGRIMTRTESVSPGQALPLRYSIGEPSGPVDSVATVGAGLVGGALVRFSRERGQWHIPHSLLVARDMAPPGRPLTDLLETSVSVGPPRAKSLFRDRIRSVPVQLARGLRATGGESGVGDLRLIQQTHREGIAMWDVFASSQVPQWRHAPIAAVRPTYGEDGLRAWRQRWSRKSRNTGEIRQRRWAYSETRHEVELASLPLPWFDMGSSRPVDVRLWHREAADGAARLTLHVADPHFEGLLEILRHGRLGVARVIVDSLERGSIIDRIIHRKIENPLGACAAAYVGLAIFDPSEQERWDSWLPNIRHWFRWLPDGAILHARRIMLRPRDRAETEQILPALKEAFAAGIPFYSAGLQLMQEMMGIYCNDEESEEMARKVNRIAARLSTAEAFTVLRYSKER